MEGLQLKNEFDYSDKDFWDISRLVTEHSGIELPESKKSLVYSRLVRRLRTLNIMRFSEYYELVKADLSKGNEQEFLTLINAITTNVTHLFREHHHFDHLKEHLKLLSQTQDKINIWSCAASIGAEPWSIAMVVHEFCKENPSCKVRIIASDIDSEVLKQAQKGVYEVNPENVKANPYLKKYLKLEKTEGSNSPLHHSLYKISDEIRPYMEFRQINLLHNWQKEFHSKFDFVFCRNVIIYFSKQTQKQLFEKITEIMNVGAYLYLGHSESLLGITDDFENQRQTTYKKVR